MVRIVPAVTAAAAVMAVLTPGGAAAAAPCGPASSARTVTLTGVSWWVRDSVGSRQGPGPNVFDCRNVSATRGGGVRMIIRKRHGVWTSSQIHPYEQAGYGYGRYEWTLDRRSVAQLPASAVLGLFTWSQDPAFANREIDIEVTRWGIPRRPRTSHRIPVWFSVQRGAGMYPYQRRAPLPVGGKSVAFSLDWGPDRIQFGVDGTVVWDMSKGVPPEGGVVVPAINLWLTEGRPAPARVLVRRFSYERLLR